MLTKKRKYKEVGGWEKGVIRSGREGRKNSMQNGLFTAIPGPNSLPGGGVMGYFTVPFSFSSLKFSFRILNF